MKLWDELEWEDAWNGKYPRDIDKEEIEIETDELIRKIERIRLYGFGSSEYRNLEEHRRMIVIESFKTISLFNEAQFT